MKKLLLVLAIVAMASFLFVGCIPGGTTPDPDPDPDPVPGDCPTVSVTSQVAVAGKNYIKAGTQTITVTFAVPTAPVSVYVGAALKDNPDGVPTSAEEVVLYTADGGLIYTGTVLFAGDCDEAYIYVLTCDTCAPCKYPYTVDGLPPEATVEICIDDCTCAGCELIFSSDIATDECLPDDVLCDDACSGFASWSIDIYDKYPFDECCLTPCYEPIESDSGVCPIDFTTSCLDFTTDIAYVVVTLVDNVGNSTKFGADIEFNPDSCDILTVTPWAADECVDSPTFVVCSVLGVTATLNAAVAK